MLLICLNKSLRALGSRRCLTGFILTLSSKRGVVLIPVRPLICRTAAGLRANCTSGRSDSERSLRCTCHRARIVPAAHARASGVVHVVTKSLRQRHVSMWQVLELHTRNSRKTGRRPQEAFLHRASDMPAIYLQ